MRKIKDGIWWVGILDWDRRLFDELIPLPDGTSYNSYFIEGKDKNALIDTVNTGRGAELLEQLKELGAGKIDYLFVNHAEQDHTGSMQEVLGAYPMAKVVTNEKCKQMIMDLLLISPDRVMTVRDGECIPLGGRTLECIIAPWVHWPETMLTYLREDRLLFTCDFLGSHLATSRLFAGEEPEVYESAKRYYAQIMMPFRTSVRKHLEKVKKLELDMIAPSHGPVYSKPGFIIKAYEDWASDSVKNEAVIAYVSMHGSVEKMVNCLADGLMQRGVAVKPFNLTGADTGRLAMSLVDAATAVIGTPTVLAGPHPLAVYAAYLVNALRPKLKFASVIGSYSWQTKVAEQIAGMLGNLKIEVIEPVIAKGYPKEEDFKALDRLADTIAHKHMVLGVVPALVVGVVPHPDM